MAASSLLDLICQNVDGRPYSKSIIGYAPSCQTLASFWHFWEAPLPVRNPGGHLQAITVPPSYCRVPSLQVGYITSQPGQFVLTMATKRNIIVYPGATKKRCQAPSVKTVNIKWAKRVNIKWGAIGQMCLKSFILEKITQISKINENPD